MALDKNIPTSLDVDAIKESLINFFETSTDFKDYDFEGSTINTFVDLLVKNTNILAYLAHINATEIFMDDAQIRRNVIAEAKKLGYIPKSTSAARSFVNIEVTPTSSDTAPASIFLEKETLFLSALDDQVFYFVAPETYQTSLNAGKYTFENVELLQGAYKTFSYTLTESSQKLEIPSDTVDTTTISVSVKQSINDAISTSYKVSDTIIEIDETSKVFFLSENKNGKYQIEFGNGNIGRSVPAGSYVTVKYLESDGAVANGCGEFDAVSSIGGYSQISTTTVSKAFGGSDQENMESVKFTAPKFFMSQNRAVTPDDYSGIVKRYVSGVEYVKSWGGEDNDPPTYGTVYIAVKMKDSQLLTTAIKKYISTNVLRKYKVGTATPEVVDPDYVDIKLDLSVNYDPTQLEILDSELMQLIRNQSVAFSSEVLSKFDTKFRTSKFLHSIDGVHAAINNSYIKNIHLVKRGIVEVGVKQSVNVKFNDNPIQPGSVRIEGFRVLDTTTQLNLGNVYYVRDDMNGSLSIYRMENEYEQVVQHGIGTVDYTTGLVSLNSLTVLSTDYNDSLYISVSPQEQNINSFNSDILTISDSSNVTVDLVRE